MLIRRGEGEDGEGICVERKTKLKGKEKKNKERRDGFKNVLNEVMKKKLKNLLTSLALAYIDPSRRLTLSLKSIIAWSIESSPFLIYTMN